MAESMTINSFAGALHAQLIDIDPRATIRLDFQAFVAMRKAQ